MYVNEGTIILATAADVCAAADLIAKVKVPFPSEYDFIKNGQIIFTYFHFVALCELTKAMLHIKAIYIAYASVELADNSLPLLIPMSEV